MKKKDKQYLEAIIDKEGFGYAFIDYSDFEEIEDEKFHVLRKAFVDAAEKLQEYISL